MITKSIIISYDAGTHTVVVRTMDSGTYWRDIPVALTIPAGDCTVGNFCAVASFNATHPTDAVVIATWA